MRGGGKVTAAFSKRGRVALVTHDRAGGAAKRARLRGYRHAAVARPRARAPVPRLARRVFTVRRGKVRSVAIASPRTIKRRALLRRYLRAASSA